MRKKSELRPGLERKLGGYLSAAAGRHRSVLKDLLAWAVPAGTVGLGILGGSELVLANTIVYTPAHMPMNRFCTFGTCHGGSGPNFYFGTLAFDVNHDGVNDFGLFGRSFSNIDDRGGNVDVFGAGAGDGVAAGAKGAGALSKGARIGYGLNFSADGLMVSGVTYFFRRSRDRVIGSWATQYGGNVNAFLGLEFKVGASTYFGWAEFDEGTQAILNATLEGYAYNSVPGQGLYAGETNNTPEPGTLGLLALGTLGLGFWRRRKAGNTVGKTAV